MPEMAAGSDDVRHARPLRHVHSVTFDQAFTLELVEMLPGITVAYETYGTLSAARDNAILVCHALSGDSHVARHDGADDPGWWDAVVGPGKAIDTRRFFVICPNVLGGCRGTTGPASINPATGGPWGRDFPLITIGDIVEVQRRLLDHLGIERLHAVTGGSMGGHQAIQWAVAYPARVGRALIFGSSARLTQQALAFDIIGRRAILGGGGEGEAATPRQLAEGLAIARMLGHITYLSAASMARKFGGRQPVADLKAEFDRSFAVGTYLAHQGKRFVERFDPLSYVTLTRAMDLFDLHATPGGLEGALAPATCRWMLVSFTSDWLFPAEQSAEIAGVLRQLGREVVHDNVETQSGHDAFLLAGDVARFGEAVRGFLEGRVAG
jgi:homoserine O-acetyltransferase